MYTHQSEMNDKLATAATITHPYPPSGGTGTNSYFTVSLSDPVATSSISGSCFLSTVDTISGGCLVLDTEAIIDSSSPSVEQYVSTFRVSSTIDLDGLHVE